MALREVLAFLGVEVEGTDEVDRAQEAIDRYKAAIAPTVTESEKLRIKQAELAEMAQRTAARIRDLQKAEGDHAGEIELLRIAQQRMTAEAKRYGDEAKKSEGGTERQRTGIEQLISGYRGLVGVVGVAVAATAGLRAAAESVVDLVTGVIELGAEIDHTAQQLGVGRDALQEWRYIAEQSGVAGDQLGDALRTLNQTSTEASRGGGEAVHAFRQLGVQLRGADGQMRSTEAIFSDTITALAGVSSTTERAAVASKVFGESGSRLLTIVNQGEAGIARLRDRFHELGGGLSGETVQASAEARAAMLDFDLAMTGVKDSLVSSVLPTITRLISGVADVAGQFAQLARSSSLVETALGAIAVVGAALALALAPVTVPTLLLIGIIAGLVLVVEDLVTAFRGGRSVFGGALERLMSMMGVTVTFTGLVEALGVSWDEATARAREGLATLLDALVSVQRAVGIPVPDSLANAARSARRAASEARARATSSQVDLYVHEQQRQEERARRDAIINAPPPPVVETRSGRERRRERAAAARGGNTVHAPITINGAHDPAAVGREVQRAISAAIRSSADTLPLAPEPG